MSLHANQKETCHFDMGTCSWPWMSVGRLRVTLFVRCAFVGKECLLLCGVSDDRFIAYNFVCWLFGGCMVGLVVLFVPLLLSFLAMPGLCRFLGVTL